MTLHRGKSARARRAAVLFAGLLTMIVGTACRKAEAPAPAPASEHRTFPTAEDAVRALDTTVKAGKLDELIPLFGPEGRDLVSSSDPATGRQNREVFTVAFAEQWHLEDLGPDRKELVIGNEDWPFPIPLVKEAAGWRFDTAAGQEEVLARRIGRNELAAIRTCDTYVVAQRDYASRRHDGKAAGLYARKFASDPGTENGLYWPVKRGAPRSPLGDLVAQAAADGYRRDPSQQGPTPFHGYYFRILEEQGPAAPGGAAKYGVDGAMSKGFALIAWPAQYDATGIMSFIVNQDGVVHEKDLGPDTAKTVAAIVQYDPDLSWTRVGDTAPTQ